MGDNLRTGFASVVVDERAAFEKTMDVVLSKKFKRIAVIGHRADGEKRCRGFSEAELKKAFDPIEITEDGIVQLPASLPSHWKSLTVTGVGTERKTYRVENNR